MTAVSWRHRLILLGLSLASVLAATWVWRQVSASGDRATQLDGLLAQRMPARTGSACQTSEPGTRRFTTILALGQSNAGNHGAVAADAPSLDLLLNSGQCQRVHPPLPGATGSGDSIWPRLNQFLEPGNGPLRWSVLALDASSISDWTDSRSPVRQALLAQIAALSAADQRPDLVLWQQGEADARQDTSLASYQQGLMKLSELLHAAGVKTPLLLAKSTICRSAPNPTIRQAIDEVVARWPDRFQPGPDIDMLNSPAMRHDGCHFTSAGLEQAARLWAVRITPLLSQTQP